eukprot:3850877-Alexandrium_andersonii.AAC.1
MSASLVGSEMCIRDRPAGAPPPPARPPRQPRGHGLGSPPPREGCGAREAVSYTHLTLPTICSV